MISRILPMTRRGAAVLAMTLLTGATLADARAAEPGVPGGYPVTVVVGDPGNAADATGYGAVPYSYRIGKYEVTNEEYCEFLNAVAAKDRYDLYDDRMSHTGDDDDYGGIIRTGSYGTYKYRVREGMGKKPVNYVTWESALRYCNWLSNGKGEGDTESGVYSFQGGEPTLPDHAALAKGDKIKWVLPTENEWYKAAYFDPKKPGGAGYWPLPTRSDSDAGANLNTNAPSDAGQFAASAYGTHDQGGNVWEWNESRNGGHVGLRGGSFYINDNEGHMRSGARYDVLSAKWPNYGFRVAALGAAPTQ